jgi:hypothetical protein
VSEHAPKADGVNFELGRVPGLLKSPAISFENFPAKYSVGSSFTLGRRVAGLNSCTFSHGPEEVLNLACREKLEKLMN